jgi:hypothetical protein
MKSPLLRMLSFSALLFLVSACNNESSKDSTVTNDSTSTATAASTDANTNTTVTTPQNMVIAKHRVKDFAAWKSSFDEHDSLKLANGLHNYVIGRSIDDSNMVLVALKADDMDKAKAFAKDASLKQAMQKGGVMGTPSFHYITMTFQDTAHISSMLRSETTFNVKDWAQWEKNFKEGEQERIDNGVTVRAYGHDPDDDKKVRLVVALTDTAKARAYWNSDMLKKRREASGVTSTPDRFVFRVVQRY